MLWFSAAVGVGYCAYDKDPFEAELFDLNYHAFQIALNPLAARYYTAKYILFIVTRDPKTLIEEPILTCASTWRYKGHTETGSRGEILPAIGKVVYSVCCIHHHGQLRMCPWHVDAHGDRTASIFQMAW